jgi:hypothetical protein
MKLRKFNENSEYSTDRLKDMLKQKKLIEQELRNYLELLNQFFSFTIKYLPRDLRYIFEHQKEYGYDENNPYTFDLELICTKDRIEVGFSWDDDEEHENIILTSEIIEDLEEFFKDPKGWIELYKDTRKYNL